LHKHKIQVGPKWKIKYPNTVETKKSGTVMIGCISFYYNRQK